MISFKKCAKCGWPFLPSTGLQKYCIKHQENHNAKGYATYQAKYYKSVTKKNRKKRAEMKVLLKGGEKKMADIQTTTDYDKFKLVVGNRAIRPAHVSKLAASILKNNMLAENPILVNENMEIIDGQHRFEVAKTNELPVYYIVVKNADINNVMQLNQVQQMWRGKDFVQSYAARGFEHYIWLDSFMTENKLSLSQALTFLYGSDDNWVFTSVKSGRVVAREEQRTAAERRAGILWELRPHLKVLGAVPKAMVRAIVEIDETNQTQALIKGIREKATVMVPKVHKKEALDQLRSLL